MSEIRITLTIFQLGRGGDKIFVQLGEHGQGRGRDGLPAAGFQGERQDQGGGDAGRPNMSKKIQVKKMKSQTR